MNLYKRLAAALVVTMFLAQGAPAAMAAPKGEKGPAPQSQKNQKDNQKDNQKENPGQSQKAEPKGQAKKAAPTPEEKEQHISTVKAESREQAKSERKAGEKGAYLVYVNGKKLNVTPIAKGGRTLVPFRFLAESLGADVDWVPSSQTVIMTKGDITVTLTIGSLTALVNGEEVTLETAPDLVDGRTIVPLRFIAEVFGADVDYDEETGAITVITLPGVGDDDDADEDEDEDEDENTEDEDEDENTGDEDEDENTGDEDEDENTGDEDEDENTGDEDEDENTGDEEEDEDAGDDEDDEDAGDDAEDEDAGDDEDDEETGEN